MLIAQAKRKENIAEYLLYLFHIEFIIRALDLNIDEINKQLISQYDVEKATRKEIEDWYINLIALMKNEQKVEKGHLQFIENLINDVNEFHLRLIKANEEKTYIDQYQKVYPILTELKQKGAQNRNFVHIALDTIYGTSLLKMQQKDISKETEKAVMEIADWLAMLSKHYRDFENGDLQL